MDFFQGKRVGRVFLKTLKMKWNDKGNKGWAAIATIAAPKREQKYQRLACL